MSDEFSIERELLLSNKQLVLTGFSSNELKQFYDIERLAYEIWRSSAMLRIIGKGAPIIVADFKSWVFDFRSDELDRLVTIFDTRNHEEQYLLSATGLVFDFEEATPKDLGPIFVPAYNISEIPLREFEGLFEILGIRFAESTKEFPPNFIWVIFALRQFKKSHTPFAEAFENKYNVSLNAVLAVVASILQRIFFIWKDEGYKNIIKYWQRAYEGPYTREYIIKEIFSFLPEAIHLLGIEEGEISEDDLINAMKFWELNNNTRSRIDLVYAGPHSIFLPYGTDRLFIDYVWIIRRLYHLFLGVSLSDQNFKGAALEELVRDRENVLPVKSCVALDGSKKQIDASYALNNRLIIIECKAIGKSIGFSRGDPNSIRFRNQIVNNVLDQIDEKARWLAAHPIGTNYDISGFDFILPIGVTPFTEYIPSLSLRYWIAEYLPRVMTPNELKKSINNDEFIKTIYNIIPIQKSGKTDVT